MIQDNIKYVLALSVVSILTFANPAVVETLSSSMSQSAAAVESVQRTATGPVSRNELKVISPKAGDILVVGKPYKIQWQSKRSGYSSQFTITEYANQVSKTIVDNKPAHTFKCTNIEGGICEYMWTPSLASANYKISVSQRTNGGYYYNSTYIRPGSPTVAYSGVFSTVAAPVPTIVTTKITGASIVDGVDEYYNDVDLTIGKTYTIKWNEVNIPLERVKTTTEPNMVEVDLYKLVSGKWEKELGIGNVKVVGSGQNQVNWTVPQDLSPGATPRKIYIGAHGGYSQIQVISINTP